MNNVILLNIYCYISNFRKLGLSYPPNDKKWAKEILEYDGPKMSPSITDTKRICTHCQAHLLPHEHKGLCCNHGQVTNQFS